MTEEVAWHRLHPLSPIVRGGRLTIGLVIILLPALVRGDLLSGAPQAVIAVLAVAAGFVSWLVTRWRVEDDDLRIETGLLRRQSLRYPLAQVQAIDIVQPGLARLFGLAELRLRMAGATAGTARLAYLRERDAAPLRDRLLALAHGAGAEEQPEPREERVLTTVPTGRLVAAIALSDVGVFAEAVLVALIVTAAVSPSVAVGLVTASITWIVIVPTLVWRRFNQEYRLTVAEAHDGLRLRSGLVALTAETIRPGRVQAVRMVEPAAWRLLGWCRLQVDLAGTQKSKGEGQAERRPLRTILPVGSRALADELLDQLLPDRPREQTPPPRRARFKSPLRYRKLAWGRTDTCVVATSGRLRRVTSWVPLEKVQSLRRVEGPVQRRLRLASVHVDTAGRGVHTTLRDRDAREADGALEDLTRLARAARRSVSAGAARAGGP